ncbi:hypothetical protein D9M70_630960 [compost metagenome]
MPSALNSTLPFSGKRSSAEITRTSPFGSLSFASSSAGSMMIGWSSMVVKPPSLRAFGGSLSGITLISTVPVMLAPCSSVIV